MNTRKDMVVLVADKNMEFAVRGILSRPKAIGLRNILYDIFVHPERDPGCLNRGSDFLRAFSKSHAHALILFDRDGCGRETEELKVLEEEVEKSIAGFGWKGYAAVVIAPELENWVWSDSPHVDEVLGWAERQPALRRWLCDHGHWPDQVPKPFAPKEALEAAIREVGMPRTSAMYHDLAIRVSFERCKDRAFIKLKDVLKTWFGQRTT
ncbi:MAG: hypothetical protein V2A66_08630 [Pseudomonadota bacterium]